MKDPLLTLGFLGLAVGFLAIGLGWLGSARKACVDCQIPYLISGGAAGLGFVVAGSAFLVIRALRHQQERLDETFGALREHLAVAGADGSGPRGNGHRSQEVVTVGASSYHRSSCHLVEGRGEAETVPLDIARARELAPCRVCGPPS